MKERKSVLRPLAYTRPKPPVANDLADVVDLSLLLIRAAESSGISHTAATRFLDELVALPNQVAQRIVAERRLEFVRRTNARVRREDEQETHRRQTRREEP